MACTGAGTFVEGVARSSPSQRTVALTPTPAPVPPPSSRGGLQGRQASVGSLITRNTCLPSALCQGRGAAPRGIPPEQYGSV